MSAQELARYGIIENTIEGYLNVAEAREQFHLARRQVFRLKRKSKGKGIEGLIHGKGGRASPRRTKERLRDMIGYF